MKSEGNSSPPKMAEILDAHRGENHIIVLQDYPDPDALSSAFAHQLISGTFDIRCDIVYNAKISHPQNVALVKLQGRSARREEVASF
jgi:nanoRNase/pAp phosphatase (c-di-AMP/oligoRNAs hydrolase)